MANPLGIAVGDIITGKWAGREWYWYVIEVKELAPELGLPGYWGVTAWRLRNDLKRDNRSVSPMSLSGPHYLINSKIIKRNVLEQDL